MYLISRVTYLILSHQLCSRSILVDIGENGVLNKDESMGLISIISFSFTFSFTNSILNSSRNLFKKRPICRKRSLGRPDLTMISKVRLVLVKFIAVYASKVRFLSFDWDDVPASANVPTIVEYN